jgi:copper(I)-binding protein
MKSMTLGLLAAALLLPLSAMASEATQVTVSHPWIRVLPGALPAAGYATLSNGSDQPAALVGAESPAYDHIMLHESTIENGMSHMRMIKRLAVPVHGTVKLAPGGYHLMMMKAKHAVMPGQMVKVTLHFADGSEKTVDFAARPANAANDAH